MKTIQTLTLDEAKRIADGAETKAIELGVKIAISIMDQHGNLKYFRRMDDNNAVSVQMSQLKALTSSRIPLSTKQVSEKPNSSYYLAVPGIVLLEGGLPLFTKEGHHVGSIGISGANPEIDGVCAKAGVDAL